MSHYYAMDEIGCLVSASEAIGGIDYYCPNCYAPMRLRKCLTRTSHFFVYADKHKSRDCGEIEKDRDVIRTTSLLDPKKFERAVMNPRNHSRGSGTGGGGKGSASTSHKEMLPPNSIRQLVVCGARSMDPASPIEGGTLSDIYIGPKSYEKHFCDGSDLDFRVVELWLNSALNRRIRYVANWTYRGQLFRGFLEHHVDEALNFEELADMLFHERRDYYGYLIWQKPKYKTIAVGGVWSAAERSHCQKVCNFCKNARRTCRGMWFSPLTSLKQIYFSDLPDNLFEAAK